VLKYKKTAAALIALMFLLGMSSTISQARASPATIHVYEGQSIQSAINVAMDRSLIIVHEGTYHEGLAITKRLSLLGIGAVIDLEGTAFQIAVQINAPEVTFSGFTIQNVPAVQHAGAIHIGGDTSMSGGLIADNTIYSGFYGIVVNAPTNVEIRNNSIHTSVHAIYIVAGSDIIARGNTVHATQMGITMWGPKASIFDNVIYAGFYGVNVMDCNQANIRNNQIQAGEIGIHLMGSDGAVSHNSISGEFWSGIAVEANSKSNRVLSNQITGGSNQWDVGIHLGSETSKNLVALNRISGVYRKIVDEGIGNIIIVGREPTSARFEGTAIGECFIGTGWVLGPQPPVAAFIGEGEIRVRGSCAVDEYPPNPNVPFTFYLAGEGARASGTFSAKWEDQMIRVSIHSEDDTCGFFVDQGDVNYFTVGVLPGDPLWAVSMTYNGVCRDKTGIYAVSGKCGVFAMPIGDPGQQIMAMGAALFKQDATPLLSMFWVPSDIPLGPPPSTTLHAADQFVHSVEIVTEP